jgi:hypothetical protein
MSDCAPVRAASINSTVSSAPWSSLEVENRVRIHEVAAIKASAQHHFPLLSLLGEKSIPDFLDHHRALVVPLRKRLAAPFLSTVRKLSAARASPSVLTVAIGSRAWSLGAFSEIWKSL